jgi:phthiocerol/phenolphthiocerol synthesis type-I polyketide synthase E
VSQRGATGRVEELPNGLQVICQSRVELRQFYADIFEKEIYLRHGVTLGAGACVFDVGANIGLFTLFVQQRWPDSVVYAFEPAPPLYDILQGNVARHGPQVRTFNCGLSDRAGRAAFTFYPNSSGMSSFHADLTEERQALAAILENERRGGDAEVAGLMPYLDDYLAVRLEARPFTCQLETLSAMIRAQGVSRIDLVKIDVQKSEWQVLQGIAEEDWPKIRQFAMEVHDRAGRLAEITALLGARGYEVTSEQDELYHQSELWNLFAVRRAEARQGS